MPSAQSIENTLLSASLLMANQCTANLVQLSVGNDELSWASIRRLNRNINALQYQYNTGQYDATATVTVYNCLNSLIGFDTTINNLDPNFQNSTVVYDVTAVTNAQANYDRIIFGNVDTVSLSDFQATYVDRYGDNAIAELFVTTDAFATVQQDTGTVPTIVNLGGDINKPDSYTWTFGIPTTGYIQITGFVPESANIVSPPITNTSSVLLDNATLNGLYPTALWGQLILLPNVPAKYEKLDNSSTGQWDLQTYTPNS